VRFVSLGSGSRGNATLIESGETRLLLDCGFSARELASRLAQVGVEATSLDAILVTHEHQDHIKGVGALARRYQLPVWLTHGTLGCQRLGRLPATHLLHGHQEAFSIGGIQVTPYSVPHDAREPVQYLFQSAGRRLGVLTDAGTITPHIIEVLSGCSSLLLECNHDPAMLACGPYPPSLQRRVGGRLGHLNNGQAAWLAEQVDHAGLNTLVAAHLSEQNNTPELARDALLDNLPGLASRLSITHQDHISGWFEA